MKSSMVLCVVLILAGCASSERVRDDLLPLDRHLAKLGLSQGEPVESITRSDIDDWDYLDKRHIVLGRSPGQRYLLEFTRDCDRLDYTSVIGYSATVGLLTSLDHVKVLDGMGGVPQTCQIEQLYRLERVETQVP